MKCYLVPCVAGFIAFSENLNVVDYELFSKESITLRLLEFEKGLLLPEEKKILKRLVKNCEKVFIESEHHSKYEEFKGNISLESLTKGGENLRQNLKEVLDEIGFIKKDDFRDFIHEVHMGITLQRLRESFKEQDKLVIQAVNALEDLDETIGKLVERIREWYSIYFPELDSIRDHGQYVKLIAEHGMRESIMKIGEVPSQSIGTALEEDDVLVIMKLARSIRSLQRMRKSIEKYLNSKMEHLAPNLKDVAGPILGAKLIAHAGNIRKLAILPSSTIQVMGAEKALFRHLRTGSKPPKHGLIYQHPLVRGSKGRIRGKIARALASKISLAVRKDVFSQEYDPRIKESFHKKVKIIENVQKKM